MKILLTPLRPLLASPIAMIDAVVVAAGVAFAIVFPFIASEPTIGVGFIALIYATRNLTWNIAGGITGLMSLAHASAFGLGAFAVGILAWQHGWSVWLAIAVGMAIAAVLGLLISLVMSRFGVSALFFTLGTLAMAVAISGVAASWSVAGTVNGLQNMTTGEGLAHLQWFTDPTPFYFVTLVVLAIITAGTALLLRRTRFGRSLPFIREDPVMAASMGVRVVRNQAIAMSLSMGLTAIPGALMAQYVSFVSYDSVLSIDIGISMMVGAIIGGSTTLAGPIVAGIGVAFLEELLRTFAVSSSNVSSYTQIAFAAIVILLLRFGGQGLVPLWHSLLQILLRQRGRSGDRPGDPAGSAAMPHDDLVLAGEEADRA